RRLDTAYCGEPPLTCSLQYFFSSCLDMVELLAFCWAMQSLICCLAIALLLVPLLLVLGASVEDGEVELGY
ncbi:MAG TPA: hypothetical protein VET66_03450, partial [Steroidobacteraceae bacterium]|nr:hypothetical protein [Steroidobacteraceae bacterium]